MKNFPAKTPWKARHAPDPLLTSGQAVEALGISYATFRTMISNNEIQIWRRGQAIGKPRGWFRVRRSEIDRVLNARAGEATR